VKNDTVYDQSFRGGGVLELVKDSGAARWSFGGGGVLELVKDSGVARCRRRTS
jgi:hypothetical protein